MRHAELEWREQCLAQRSLPSYTRNNDASLAALYRAQAKRAAAKNRQLALIAAGLLPAVLVLIAHLKW